MEIDGNEVYFSGSIRARGRVWVGGIKTFDEDVNSGVLEQGFRFHFPDPIGTQDWNPFD
jgi:predicted acyltransferase (DUF342 family)